MKTFDWTAASPGVANLSGSVGQYNQAAQQLFDSLGAVSKTAKDYGDSVTEENTNELISMLNKAESPEELDGIINNIQSMAESQYFGNVDNKTLNQAIDKRPMELMSRVATKDNYGQLQQEITDRPFMSQATTAYGNRDVNALTALYPNLTAPNNQEAVVNMTRTLQSDQASAEKARRDLERQNAIEADRIADRARKIAEEAAGGSSGSGNNNLVKNTDGGQTDIVAGQSGTDVVNFENGMGVVTTLTNGVVNTPEAVGRFLIDQGVLANLEVDGRNDIGKGRVNPDSKALGWMQILPSTWKDAFTRSPNAQAIAQKYGTTVEALKNNPRNDNDPSNPGLYNDVGKMVMDLKLRAIRKYAPNVPINAFTAAVGWQLGEGNMKKFWEAYEGNRDAKMNDLGLDMGKFGSNFTRSQRMENSDLTVGQYAQAKLDRLQTNDQGALLKAGANSAGIPRQVMEDFYTATQLKLQPYSINAIEIGSTKDPSYLTKPVVDKLKASSALQNKREETKSRGWIGISTAENAVEGLDLFIAKLAMQGVTLNPETELSLLGAGIAKNDRGMLQERPTEMAKYYLDTYANLLRNVGTAQLGQIENVVTEQLLEFGRVGSKYNFNGSLDRNGLLEATVKRTNPDLYQQLLSEGKSGYVEPALIREVRNAIAPPKGSANNPFDSTNSGNAVNPFTSSRSSNSFVPNASSATVGKSRGRDNSKRRSQ